MDNLWPFMFAEGKIKSVYLKNYYNLLYFSFL